MESEAALSVSHGDGETESCLQPNDNQTTRPIETSENEHKRELEVDDRRLAKKPRLEMEVIDSDEGDSGSVKQAQLDAVLHETGDHEGGGATRLPNEHRSLRRAKSTSAAVLLGLIKSRVKKLAVERRKTAAAKSPAASAAAAAAAAAGYDSPASHNMDTPPVSVARTPKSSQTGRLSDWVKPFDLGK